MDDPHLNCFDFAVKFGSLINFYNLKERNRRRLDAILHD